MCLRVIIPSSWLLLPLRTEGQHCKVRTNHTIHAVCGFSDGNGLRRPEDFIAYFAPPRVPDHSFAVLYVPSSTNAIKYTTPTCISLMCMERYVGFMLHPCLVSLLFTDPLSLYLQFHF